MITDSFNRTHNYLRISLTDSCNLRCFYCMPEEDYEFTPTSRLMKASEIESLAKVFVAAGVDKIRLTGGEPLVRRDAVDIINRLSQLQIELSLTTNGTRLHHFVDTLLAANIRSVNVSLDTLDRQKFKRITRRDQFDVVYDNIQELLRIGIRVKVNVVVMKGVNDDELTDFVAWTKFQSIDVRFIEFMPFTGNRWTNNQVMTLHEMLQVISNEYDFSAVTASPNETVKRFQVPGFAGTFGVISTMSSHFCGSCNRMRLTADGKLKNCLFSEYETDLLSALRDGQDVEPLIRQCAMDKHFQLGGQLAPDLNDVQADQIHNRSMITIGG
ncbi:GTP 3',8-cyclase MoaA [Dyadobacter sp. CY261]|uniref:GTP 3',8-cyclase MoaA n=1 Tax=Dyadobacter sp. CY261 TaxID=2907203 RepID=UPI001F1B4B57|nr:GTP 3',8-cyclase MoaA [Dyadobacter sp. CY261]MCF0075365.1 GTP 3',8-cyclase MoaA [Dyadobacter sp. CY261]